MKLKWNPSIVLTTKGVHAFKEGPNKTLKPQNNSPQITQNDDCPDDHFWNFIQIDHFGPTLFSIIFSTWFSSPSTASIYDSRHSASSFFTAIYAPLNLRFPSFFCFSTFQSHSWYQVLLLPVPFINVSYTFYLIPGEYLV